MSEVDRLKKKIEKLESKLKFYEDKVSNEGLTPDSYGEEIDPWYLSRVHEMTGMGIWQLNLATDDLVWSDMNYRLFGYEPNSGLTPTQIWKKTLDRQDFDDIELLIDESIQEGTDFLAEFHITRENRERCYIGGRASVVYDQDGKAQYLIGANWDMTKQWKDQQSLKKFLTTIEQSPAGIIITDSKGYVDYVNPYCLTMLGCELSEVINESVWKVNSEIVTNDFINNVVEQLSECDTYNQEIDYITQGGKMLSLQALISCLRDNKGTITHYVGIFED